VMITRSAFLAMPVYLPYVWTLDNSGVEPSGLVVTTG